MRALLALAALLLAGCTGPAPDSGITGRAMMGPMCPVQQDPPDPQCADRPYEGRLAVVTAVGARRVAEFATDAEGRFNVSVAPGEYIVRSPEPGSRYPRCESQPVSVAAGRYILVEVPCDTGIR